MSASGVSLKWVKSKRRKRKRDRKLVITLASYSLQTPPKVGQNNKCNRMPPSHHKIKLTQAALHAPPEVAFAMCSWPLLLPTCSLSSLFLFSFSVFGETPKAGNLFPPIFWHNYFFLPLQQSYLIIFFHHHTGVI